MELKSVEDTSWLQLFIKNTALCKHESGRIRCDACPVPEGLKTTTLIGRVCKRSDALS
ncbi:hypothetical protein FHB04_18675 [Escherichia coli]|nr:hypothetical protein [Escherichia coli]